MIQERVGNRTVSSLPGSEMVEVKRNVTYPWGLGSPLLWLRAD